MTYNVLVGRKPYSINQSTTDHSLLLITDIPAGAHVLPLISLIWLTEIWS